MEDFKVMVSIAARKGSKGIPGKNLRLLNGMPLIAHTIRTALSSSLVNRVIVSTDCSKIASVAEFYGAEVPFARDPDLANDSAPLLLVTKDTATRMAELGFHSDIVVQLATTCPFISCETLNLSIKKAAEFGCSVTLKRVEHEHPYRAKVLDYNQTFRPFLTDVDVEKFQSRQDLPELYCTSGGIYARSFDLLQTADGTSFCLGETPYGIVVSDRESVNIDRLIDFQFAEFLSVS